MSQVYHGYGKCGVTFSRRDPHFKSHNDIQIQTVDKVCDFSKIKQKECDDSANLKLEVSKLINNVISTAPKYQFQIKDAYTFGEVHHIT